MKVTFASASLPASGQLIVPIFSNGKLPHSLSSLLKKEARAQIETTIQASNLASRQDDYCHLFCLPGLKKTVLTLWGCGSQANFDAELFGAKVVKAFRAGDESRLIFHFIETGLTPEELANVAIGARLAGYRFDNHRSKSAANKKTKILSLKLCVEAPNQAKKHYHSFLGPVCDGQLLARDLVNEPANILFPKAYAQRIETLKESGLKIKILGEKEMKALKMKALLGVGQGSARESQLAIMTWMGGPKDQAPICLVGKGITFDSGGISIKPTNGMWNMKGDMGGSAAVVGSMQALAMRQAKVNVIGIVALAENMPDGQAQNPGDVITSMSGQTIELQSTDAEGRLVLADAITYAVKKFKPKVIVDLATLTGAKVVALGHEHAGLFTNHDDLAKEFELSSQKSSERIWRLPLLPEYDQMLNSETADMKNSVSGGAGAITAAQFIQRFVEGTPWVHLDIAGSSSKVSRKDPREPSFAIGYGVRLLNQWLADHYEQ